MLVLGDTYAGKTSLIRALASHYLDDEPYRTNVVDIYGYYLSTEGNISFVTDEKNKPLHVWELNGKKIYRAFHRSLIQKHTLTLVLIDSTRPERGCHALKEWTLFCESVGISNPIIVFTKADQVDQSAELRATVPDAFFVSAKADSEELSRLRATIVRRAAESVEQPNYESERLIKTVKVLTQIDGWHVSQVVRVANTLGIDDPYLMHGIFLPETCSALMAEHSIFLMTAFTDQPLSARDKCQRCTYGKTFISVSQGQCLNLSHGSARCNMVCDSLSPGELPADFGQTCAQLLHELVDRKLLYPVRLPDDRCGYFFPHLLENPSLPEPIFQGIKVQYADSGIPPQDLADEIFDLIMKAYPLAWCKDTRFSSVSHFMKAQFSVVGVEGLIKLFEFKSYIILDLPPALQVGTLLGPRFKWTEGVVPKGVRGGCTSGKYNLVAYSKWKV